MWGGRFEGEEEGKANAVRESKRGGREAAQSVRWGSTVWFTKNLLFWQVQTMQPPISSQLNAKTIQTRLTTTKTDSLEGRSEMLSSEQSEHQAAEKEALQVDGRARYPEQTRTADPCDDETFSTFDARMAAIKAQTLQQQKAFNGMPKRLQTALLLQARPPQVLCPSPRWTCTCVSKTLRLAPCHSSSPSSPTLTACLGAALPPRSRSPRDF